MLVCKRIVYIIPLFYLAFGFSQNKSNDDKNIREETLFLIIHLQEDIIRYQFSSLQDFNSYSGLLLEEIPTAFGLKRNATCKVVLEITFSVCIGNLGSTHTESVHCLCHELVSESQKLIPLIQAFEHY